MKSLEKLVAHMTINRVYGLMYSKKRCQVNYQVDTHFKQVQAVLWGHIQAMLWDSL